MQKNNVFKLFILISFLLSFLFSLSCSNGSTDSSGNAVQIADEAYTFGLPLVLVDITRRQRQDTWSKLPVPVGMNRFRHDTVLPDHTFRDFVRPNVDTFYSNAFLDLSGGPVELSLPDTGDRYHLMQLMDAYTNVFGAPGMRTTGNTGGKYIIAGPGWTGQAAYRSTTNYVWILGRTLVNDAQDGTRNVVPLMNQYTLTRLTPNSPLAEDGGPDISMSHDANTVLAGMAIDVFFNYLNWLMTINPPSSADSNIVRRMAEIGIAPGATFNLADFSAEEQDTMRGIPQRVIAGLVSAAGQFLQPVNGWSSTIASGMGNYGTNYQLRALIALTGIGANLPEDAVYFSVGRLDGTQSYVLRFEADQIPPVNAFWSLTLYEGNYLFNNALRRYTVGDRSGLVPNADGSVEIYIQNTSPGTDKANNWLPAPSSGSFNLSLLAYIPQEEMLNGSWSIPQITIVE